MNIAGVLSDQGKLVEAEEFYKKALTLEPQNADAHNNYGVFLGKMGQTTKALEKYKTALKLNPSHSVALVNMARQLRASGNIHDAEKTYKRFVYILPQNPGVSHLVSLVHDLDAKNKTNADLIFSPSGWSMHAILFPSEACFFSET